jgi:DNA primase
MALFPPGFLDDLKTQTDIVSVVSEVTPLKKAGTSWKGLCPFHQEKTPSFVVYQDKGIFKCFGCGVGGDVVKFVQLQQQLGFPDAVRALAQRAGLAQPAMSEGPEERAALALRETLTKLHDDAAAFYREQLAAPAGARARRELEARGLTEETIRLFGYGYAPAGGRETLHGRLTDLKVPLELQLKSALVVEREGGRVVDRFRTRLMIPIVRESGAVVAFGGRALEDGQVPKYLNSPETPIYSKGRMLYGLNVTKAAIKKHNYCVLVEGYFDLAQVWQGGVHPVAALCGTALTPMQARILKRYTSKAVLSLDPDAAGQGAAARSSELLVGEGFQVNVALLPAGGDPDTFIRREGASAYVERLKGSRPYLEFLLDRAASGLDLNRPDSRKTFLEGMLSVAATIPDAALRDQFADRVAHRARITESVVRDEIKRTAASRKTTAPAVAVQDAVRVKPAEQGLLWALVHRPVEGVAALSRVEPPDLEGLLSGPILALARSLGDVPPDLVPELLRERLTEGERAVLARAADAEAPTGPADDCAAVLRRERVGREITDIQDDIARLQDRGPGDEGMLLALMTRKQALARELERLKS